MKENISRKSCHENFSIKKSNAYIYSEHVHWPSNCDKDDFHWIHLYPYPTHPPSPSCTVRSSALVFYIPITISRDVIHVTGFFFMYLLYVPHLITLTLVRSTLLYWNLAVLLTGTYLNFQRCYTCLYTCLCTMWICCYVHLLNVPYVTICLVRSELWTWSRGHRGCF